VGEILHAAQQRAKYLKSQILPSEPTRAAKMIGEAAKELQLSFEELPSSSYTEAGVAELVMQAVALREIAHQYYLKSDSPFNAGHEQGYAAHCLETYAQPLVEQKIEGPVMGEDTPIDVLDKALHLRYRAINLFRSRPISFEALAYELSYAGKALDFLRKNVAEFRTPEIVSRVISFRCEAASLYEYKADSLDKDKHKTEKRKYYKEANFQYCYLMRVFEELAEADPRYYIQLAKSAVRAASTYKDRKGQPDLPKRIEAYEIAERGYRQAARWSKGAEKDYYEKRAGEMIEMIERVRKKLPGQ
jgi:hypothetical protein